MFYFGIDWSQDHHDLCIQNEHGAGVSQLKFPHSAKGFQQLEAARQKLGVSVADCRVAIETTQNLLVDFLLDQHYPVYVIPTQVTNAYRQTARPSGAHTDASDAALLAELVRLKVRPEWRVQPNCLLTQQMAVIVRLIETLRRSMQRQTNQLRHLLWRVYPSAADLFADLAQPITLEFLQAYPTVHAARALSFTDFTAFCQSQHYRRTDLLAQRYAHLQAETPAVDPALAEAYRTPVQQLAASILLQYHQREEAHTTLRRLFRQHPDAALFESLPGAGELLAPALLVKFGDQRERFGNAQAVQSLAGTCPSTEHSGKKHWVRFRHGCDKEFRRIVQEFALASISKASWAAAYYQEIRPHCHSDSHAIRCLANRWLAIICKMWQTHQRYDEAYHLQRRAQRRRPKAETKMIAG